MAAEDDRDDDTTDDTPPESTDDELREDRGDIFEPTDDDGDEPPASEEDAGEADPGEDEQQAEGEADPTAQVRQAKGKPGFVPPERFNELNAENKELKARLQAIEERLQTQQEAPPPPPAPPTDSEFAAQIKDLNAQAREAMLEGDYEREDEIRVQIAEIAEQRAVAKVEAKLAEREQQAAQVQAKADLDAMAEAMVEKFPVLHGKTGNPQAVDMCIRLRNSYYAEAQAAGKPITAAKALEKAAAEVGALFMLQGEGKQPTPKNDRNEAALRRGINQSEDAPPPTHNLGVGQRGNGRINVERMTERDFRSLPEEERARLRGDMG